MAVQNTLSDLNNHLFEQLERLNDEEISGEQLDKELRRSEGMTKVAEQIIRNGELAYKTMVHMDEYGYNQEKKTPDMLATKSAEIAALPQRGGGAEIDVGKIPKRSA
jgi:hypothetical protein